MRNITISRGNKADPAFTIVELLIVIVVIAILAAITVVAYNGISNRAKESSLKSDLKNAVTQLELYKVDEGVYPSDATALTWSEDSSHSYSHSQDSFCLYAQSLSIPSLAFHVRNGEAVQEGECDAMVSTVFYDPNEPAVFTAIAEAPDGNFYISTRNGVVYRMTPEGSMTIFAGALEQSGLVNGQGTSARFRGMSDIAIDQSGNIYIAEDNNNVIRKITPTGTVSTLAGSASGVSGYAGGVGTAARFDNPRGVAVDSTGVVYVADSDNYRIRKIELSGNVVDVAGSGTYGNADGTGVAAQFGWVKGLDIDRATNTLYIADDGRHKIWKMTAAGVVTSLTQGGSNGFVDGNSATARLYAPSDIAFGGDGYLYVSDDWNNAVRKVDSSGNVTTIAGHPSRYNFIDGTGDVAAFNEPAGIIKSSQGPLYVTDMYNWRIRMITQ